MQLRIHTSISPVSLSPTLFRKAEHQMNRLFKVYESSLRLIKMIYDCRVIFFENNHRDITVKGFLFDMNRFFQQLISKFPRENISSCTIIDEYHLKQVMSYQLDKNPLNKRNPIPRPDFVLQDDHAIIAILDAKYRDLWERSLPREMLYQVGIYSLLGSKNTRKAVIIVIAVIIV